MHCNCCLCQKEKGSSNQQQNQVHRQERNADENPQRQRNELRGGQPRAARGQRRNLEAGRIVRRQQRDGVHLYTSQGSSLRRVVGSSGQVSQEPDGENRWQRALDSGRANNAVSRGRGNPQLTTNMPRQQRSQRRRGPDTSSSIGRRESSSAAQRIANRRVGQAVVLEEMAAYFRTQADVLAILGERLRPGPSTEDAMVR
ncbi:uncharacterized protein LOC119606796 [Lucilia sericata]|uniref:uncharacterized protein LOC119606796 n=1 Tax=Lucilia sericata TaxID=13632 RepID=UPI0018A837D4|nr:uncharacterized protein LOC119606796 [Lucilia sericata]